MAFRPRPGSSSTGLARPAEPRSGHREPLWRELVGQVLRSRRTDRGETQRDVADRAGISVQYLSEIERGRKEPSSEMLAAVGGALDLPLDRPDPGGGSPADRTAGRPTGPVALAA